MKNFNFLKKLVVASLFLSVPFNSFAETSKELIRYQSCWNKFVGTYFSPKTASDFEAVKSGHISGVDACMNLINRAELTQATGQRNGVSLPHNPSTGEPLDKIGYNVLKNFYQIHGSFLPSGSVPVPNFSGGLVNGEYLLYDRGGGGHASYFTKHLFTPHDVNSSSAPSYPFYKTFNDENVFRAVRWNRSGLKDQMLPASGNFLNSMKPLCLGNCEFVLNSYVVTDPETVFSIPGSVRNDGSSGASSRYRPHSKTKDIFGDGAEYYTAQGSMVVAGKPFDIPGQIEVQKTTIPLDKLQSFGGLIGFEDQPAIVPPSIHLLPTDPSRADGYMRNHMQMKDLKQPYPIRQNIYFNPGLGALTEPSHQLRKMGFSDGISSSAPQDGANRVPRKWSEDFFENVLCRKLPVIRTIDAVKYVDSNASTEETSFRHGISCMTCHASMDSLAFITRNFKSAKTAFTGLKSWNMREALTNASPWQMYVGTFLKPFLPSEITNEEIAAKHPDLTPRPFEDRFFPYRLADGDFRFRDMHGNLHDIHLKANFDDQHASIKQLGEVLKDLDDTYACFASKYINALTGVEIHLFDPGATTAPALSSRDKKLLNWLTLLTKDFKKSQSAKRLIREIIASDIFLEVDGNVPSSLYGERQ